MTKKDHWRTAVVCVFCHARLWVIASESPWDAVADRVGPSGFQRDILSDIFRAALLEEFFKFTGFLLAKRSLKLGRKIDCILVAGLIGLVCSVVEKAVQGNLAAVAVGLAIPTHITWQFNQGGHWFEYEKARASNDRPRMRSEMIMAIAVPFIFHGCWDSGLDLVIWLMAKEATAAQVISGVLILAMLALGILYTIRTIKKVRGIARAVL